MGYKILEKYLTPNKYSRPQTKLKDYKGIVVHWVANPNTSAMANRNFFESRKNGKNGYGSAHEIIDLNGDIVVCIPKDEIAYHVGSTLPYKSGSTQIYTPIAWEKLNTNSKNVKPNPNNCTYGIECCHIDWNGKMTEQTYNTLVQRIADLCIEFNLDPINDVYTHQEVVGWKDCHRWFVNNPNEWIKFKQKVKDTINLKREEVKKEVMTNFSKHFEDGFQKWIAEPADRLYEMGILAGKIENGKRFIDYNAPITRGEMAVLLDRTIDYIMKNKK